MEGTHSDEFMMNSYKMELCMLSHPHVWKSCPYVHPGEPIKRRPHSNHHPDLCPDVKKGRMCSYGPEKCYWAHNTFESWLHPERFRTMMCRDGSKCSRPICFFAHSQAQLRRPTPAAHRPPPPSPGTSSFSATAVPCQQQQQFCMPQAAAGVPRPVVPPAAVPVAASLELSAPALMSPPPPEGLTMSAAMPNWLQHMQPVGGAAGGAAMPVVSGSDCSNTGCIAPFEFHRGLAPVSAAVAPALGVAGMANLNQHQMLVQELLNQRQQQQELQHMLLQLQQQQQQQLAVAGYQPAPVSPASDSWFCGSAGDEGRDVPAFAVPLLQNPVFSPAPLTLHDNNLAALMSSADHMAPGLTSLGGGDWFSYRHWPESSTHGSACGTCKRSSTASSSSAGSLDHLLLETPGSPASGLQLQQLAANLPASVHGVLQLI